MCARARKLGDVVHLPDTFMADGNIEVDSSVLCDKSMESEPTDKSLSDKTLSIII